MGKMLCLAALLAGWMVVAGCHSDPQADRAVEAEDQRAPLAGSSANSLNSPTTGPTSEGLPGGTQTDAPPEFDPDRGARTH